MYRFLIISSIFLGFIFLGTVQVFADSASTSVSVIPPTECSDGIDNDSDGEIDFPADDGCSSSIDTDETDPVATSTPASTGSRILGGGAVNARHVRVQRSSSEDGAVERALKIVGQAQPGSVVTLLLDGVSRGATIAEDDAGFRIDAQDLNPGTYVVGVYSTDVAGTYSGVVPAVVALDEDGTTVTDLVVPPTLVLGKKDEQEVNAPVTIQGYTVPNGRVTIALSGAEKSFIDHVIAAGTGAFEYTLQAAESFVSAVAFVTTEGGVVSLPSQRLVFREELQEDALVCPQPSLLRADVDDDGRVNVVDFSIVSFWYGHSEPPLRFDMDCSGRVDLVDISIMGYYWTG